MQFDLTMIVYSEVGGVEGEFLKLLDQLTCDKQQQDPVSNNIGGMALNTRISFELPI